MTRRNLVLRRLSALFVLAGIGMVFMPMSAAAWPSTCDNCYKKSFSNGTEDAQCCLDGQCDIWIQQGYVPLISNMEWCTSWQGDHTAGCYGDANSCSASGGGGGDNDGCTITVGEYCPPSCAHCYYVF